MNSKLRVMFIIFVALALVLSFGEGFPIGRAERKEFPEDENPSKLSESIDKRLSDCVFGAKSRSKRSDAGAVNDDGQHDKDVDYEIMGKLMDEYLMKHGGNLDRELEDNEYDIIVENYEKYIREDEEKKKKEKDKAISSALTAPHQSEQHSTIRTSTEKTEGKTQQASDVHTTKRTSDDGKSISTTPTAPAESPDKLVTTKSARSGDKDKFWVTPGTIGTPDDGRGGLSWTGDSKGGHQVHVVVYFD